MSRSDGFSLARGPWNIQRLFSPPHLIESPELGTETVKSLFFEASPWKGNPTRVFSYYGCPPHAHGEKVPAMVLVHGGGGSAFIPWVELWVKRGYAAISIDTCGCTSGGGHQNHTRHAWGGPPGWGGFDQIDDPLEDQWTFHAVSAILQAHSLLRSFQEIDPERIGITGISWGGYLTCIAAGVDPRFRFAAPVYGCGFLHENSTWLEHFEKMSSAQLSRWIQHWDPSVYLPQTAIPMLWVTGTNDFAFPMDSHQKSYRLSPGARTLCITLNMPHGHGGPGENPEEIHAFANSICRGEAPLPKIREQTRSGSTASVCFESVLPLARVEFNYTKDHGPWIERQWLSIPIAFDLETQTASSTIPDGTTVYYFNLIDSRNLTVSGEYENLLSRPLSTAL